MAQTVPLTGPVIPPDVAQLAHTRGLGRLTGSYGAKRVRLIPFIGLALLAGGPLVLAAYFAVRGNWGGALIVVALGGLFLFLLLRTPNISRRQAAKRIYVFEQGFIQVDRTGPRAYFRWDAVGSVLQRITRNYTNGVYTGTTYLYTITRSDGVTVRLTHFYEGIAALGETIAREVTRVQLPRAIAAIQQGQTLGFGDLAINAAGIACAGRGSVPWREIEQVQVNRGYVSLRRAGKWLAWSGKPAAQIPNLFVFLTLAEQLRATAR